MSVWLGESADALLADVCKDGDLFLAPLKCRRLSRRHDHQAREEPAGASA